MKSLAALLLSISLIPAQAKPPDEPSKEMMILAMTLVATDRNLHFALANLHQAQAWKIISVCPETKENGMMKEHFEKMRNYIVDASKNIKEAVKAAEEANRAATAMGTADKEKTTEVLKSVKQVESESAKIMGQLSKRGCPTMEDISKLMKVANNAYYHKKEFRIE